MSKRPQLALNLFWRTFVLLAMLVAGSIVAWQQTFRVLDAEPRALDAAQQLAGLVNLSRIALADIDPINRVAVISNLSSRETVQVSVAEKGDLWQAYDDSPFAKQLVQELRSRLGRDTIIASSVNGREGLWVRFRIGNDAFWLQTTASPLSITLHNNWWWMLIAMVATVLASAAIARLINEPLRELSVAAGRIRDGEYESRLDESTLTSEIREVNMGFNRMARELGKMEEDRTVMLAGISHDLRTPLARLRLEAEMSVQDEQARHFMAQDIDQLDAIIGKFMDYARPSDLELKPVPLAALVERELQVLRKQQQILVDAKIDPTLRVLADETELGRVLLNLFENARRYGHLPGEAAHVTLQCRLKDAWVELHVRDHGPGVPADKLAKLTTPFFRGDAARTAANGAGLGLAIVEKSVQRMDGQLALSNAEGGGLLTVIRLRPAP